MLVIPGFKASAKTSIFHKELGAGAKGERGSSFGLADGVDRKNRPPQNRRCRHRVLKSKNLCRRTLSAARCSLSQPRYWRRRSPPQRGRRRRLSAASTAFPVYTCLPALRPPRRRERKYSHVW